MAYRYRSSAFLVASLFLCLCCSLSLRAVVGIRDIVGGRTDVKNVKCNHEIQKLGRFSVEEFNRRKQQEEVVLLHGQGTSNSDDGELVFSEVVMAERQVVSGINYYLHIEALQHGMTKRFDAVVAVKPWLPSKQLLAFSPSTNYTK
ncbi:PREDICTED: cysteine proteinase inhibitor 2-like [Nelumbo nucifera]|uniref:Cystatin domain-containing protein n=2 Tax=Nelumbo nucifera TaxID=4432 RepID=A0A822Z6I9_NELNU|nr:PREDICTED: cysteine proteinase inhibitor 2-like [Nelumbo nucifera]DAD37148.1 TPA_asm: hypothetical protein HUJ06_007789 [Nelumbo nucifera]